MNHDDSSEVEHITLKNPSINNDYTLDQHIPFLALFACILRTPTTLLNAIENNNFSYLKKAFIIALVCHLIYGIIMGGFSGGEQWLFSPIKGVFSIAFTSLLCFPSLYIFACLSGVNITTHQLAALFITGLALTGQILLGFLPIAFIFSFSIDSLHFMGAIHLIIIMPSLFFGLRFMMKGLAQFGLEKNNILAIWQIIFIITLLQMSTIMRPLIGTSEQFLTAEKQFFLSHWTQYK